MAHRCALVLPTNSRWYPGDSGQLTIVLPDDLLLVHERSDHYSLQPAMTMAVDGKSSCIWEGCDLNLKITQFFMAHAKVFTREQWLQVYPKATEWTRVRRWGDEEVAIIHGHFKAGRGYEVFGEENVWAQQWNKQPLPPVHGLSRPIADRETVRYRCVMRSLDACALRR
ncbi:Putative hydrogenase expression/formation protein [Tolypocladium paradoxum]|uniref:Hydrogenase expression/formation protein n=1 Tax=Tolypocladium paradoxum TaxID=94208 RepID=A0A2S4L3Q7_9HYPO|nr:Putative hydrogenase expression/formation protein [Tolypocladium paradoxum]